MPTHGANSQLKLTAAQIAKMRELHTAGVPIKYIGQRFGVSEMTARRVIFEWQSKGASQ